MHEQESALGEPPLSHRESARPEEPLNAGATRTWRRHIEPFADHEVLAERVLSVLRALPDRVLQDFQDDPRFRLAVDDYDPEKGRTVWLACPGPAGNGSRCVVLKPRLADCPEAFANDVIAHELAHAYLRNGGWRDIEDAEAAANALAASWGYVRPSG